MFVMLSMPALPDEFLDFAGVFLNLFANPFPMVMMVFANAVLPFANRKRPEKNNQHHQQNNAEHDQKVQQACWHLAGG